MFYKIFTKIFGNFNDKELKRYIKQVEIINRYENKIKKLSDSELIDKTKFFIEQYKKNNSVDSIIAEAFAVVREASYRVIGLRHFDVQIIGGLVLYEGRIAEMKTGEGKTLVSTLPAYINAIQGNKVHIITVNEYLAERDRNWVGKVFEFLGLTVSVIKSNMSIEDKVLSYKSDINYGTNSEFGFDYLRDNLVYNKEDKVQASHDYCIVDEVDSILIDEARTPLIISGIPQNHSKIYKDVIKIVPKLKYLLNIKLEQTTSSPEEEQCDFIYNEEDRNLIITQKGIDRIESLLNIDNLYSVKNIDLLNVVNQCLMAVVGYKKNVDYIVEDNKIVIIDEHTGRKLAGRTFSGGLHQAIEAKEGVFVNNDIQTLASVTYQNYFKLYKKLSGMTGTAKTEEVEFKKIYNLNVIEVPTNLPIQRIDHPDRIYGTEKEKIKAIIKDIQNAYSKGQPVLVGTISIEKNELISRELTKYNIPHNILNAKNHDKEAGIIENSGKKFAVTIATNMAGRGTDIKLGNGVLEVGGLHVIGSERHESRRIDNQLRGRSGRQGDVGSSRFYLSLEDNLIRLFASENMSKYMQKLGLKDDQELEHKWLNKAIMNAQIKVESRNFDVRKFLIEYDSVINIQRKYIYNLRNSILDNTYKINNTLSIITRHYVKSSLKLNSLSEDSIVIDLKFISDIIGNIDTNLVNNFNRLNSLDSIVNSKVLYEKLNLFLIDNYDKKIIDLKENIEVDILYKVIVHKLLNLLDSTWREHLTSLDVLKEGIHLRAYAQKQPLVEYKIESFKMFKDLQYQLSLNLIKIIINFNLEGLKEQLLDSDFLNDMLDERSISKDSFQYSSSEEPINNTKAVSMKVARNSKCPCGSGVKYKKCCGLK